MDRTVKNPYQAATPKQIAYADRLAKDAGYRNHNAARAAMHGKNKCGTIKRGEMSQLIGWLLEQ